MTLKRIDFKSRRSRAVAAGNMVHLAGQVGDSLDQDITVQAREILAKIDDLLAQAGTSKSKLVSCTIWLKTMDDFDAFNAVWDAWIDPENPPARACGEVRMAMDNILVELIPVAML